MNQIKWRYLEDIMHSRSISKVKLSRIMDYSPTTVYRNFTNNQNPSLKFVTRVIEALDLTSEEIKDIFFSKSETEE